MGAVNPFWETKPYTTPAEYRSFAGPIVPLARLPKFVYKEGEKLVADLELAQFGPTPLAEAVPAWRLVNEAGRVLSSGKLPARTIPVGLASLGRIDVSLAGLPAPSQLKLVVSINAGTSTPGIENSWDIWVYPAVTPPAEAGRVKIMRDVAAARAAAEAGASVLLLPDAGRIVDPADSPRPVLGFSSIFWNTAWTGRQPPTTLGILCNPQHPAFAAFPTEFHSNYQWWYLIRLAPKPLLLDGQDPRLRPVVQVIDDWFTNHRLGLLVEARVGQGKLMLSAIDLDRARPDDVVAAQFRA